MWAILRRLVGALLGGAERLLSSNLGRWVAGALAYLGLSFATTKVVKYSVDQWVIDALGKVPGEMAAWLSWLNLDAAVSVLISAELAALAAKGAYSGVLKLQARSAAQSIPIGSHQ